MTIIGIFDFLNRRARTKRLNNVRPVGEFRSLLEKERSRVDRNGREFSVIALQAEDISEGQGGWDSLLGALKERMRSTDEVGWFDTRRIGLLLPDTSSDGAGKVAEDISLILKEEGIPFRFRIYTYPSQWLIDGSDDAGQEPYEKRQDLPVFGTMAFDSASLQPEIAQRLPMWKRVIDILGAAFGLALLFPLLLVIAGFIKWVSPGPAFFRQRRIGYGGREFTCLKFRTMNAQAEPFIHENHLAKLIKNQDTPMNKLDRIDPRIIPLGRLLRKSGMDELPQLINVLKGEMSLIGPRPCIPSEARDYLVWHRKRFDIHPGLTGLWQVSGKNRTTFRQMISLDINYLKERSLWLDFKILLKTIPSVIAQARNRS